jgi:LPXTG cell wall anchor motif
MNTAGAVRCLSTPPGTGRTLDTTHHEIRRQQHTPWTSAPNPVPNPGPEPKEGSTITMRRTLGILALTTIGIIGLSPVAEAGSPYGGSGGSGGTGAAQVSDQTPAAGQSITVSGSGFAPNSPVSIVLEPGSTTLGTATSNASGAVSATVTIPAGTTGTGSIVLVGSSAGGATVRVSVPIAVGSSAGGLPTTGTNSTEPMIMWAVAAMAAGGVLVVGVTRRRRNTVDPS